MARPLTMEQIRAAAEAKNCDVLSKRAGKALHSYMYLHRPCGSTFKMRHNNVQQGKGCPKCRGKVVSPRRLDISAAQTEAKKHGFELIDTEYKNSISSMMYKCQAMGHIVKRSHNAMKRGLRCAACFSPPRKQVTKARFRDAIKDQPLDIKGFVQHKGKLKANIACKICAPKFTIDVHGLEKRGCR